jgi:multicomponent K+:H+ antiporter subunit A
MLETLLALPFVLALVVGLARNVSRRTTAWLAAAAPLLGLALLAWLTPEVLAGGVPQVSHAWLPEAGLLFTLRLDGLAWMFALMVLAIGVLIVMYAALLPEPQRQRRRASSPTCCCSWVRCWAWSWPATCCCWWCSGS